MKTSILRAGFALALALPAAAFAAAVPQSFTATYNVLQGGSPLGEATIVLKSAGNGQFEYTNASKGTAGLAAALGANATETSRFAWAGQVPQAVSYHYQMDASFKQKTRDIKVQGATVQVQDNSKSFSYAAVPGMIDRNTLPLALGVALRDGKQEAAFPVAVKQAVENQQFKVSGKEKITVPAGSFDTVRVDRTDADRGFNAWYAPAKYPVPVKLAQKDGGDLTLELVKFEGK
ncbi:MAG: DUF3108 domain-containing protein [Luteibacter sp.]|jgi:opacity protein-like surface antigen|uniref:DUF3108 domain-containing protein n=1 Tax=Rhodanobacteraceae TaxID=1775411 RepID=UPI00055DEBF2|nr:MULTISPECIES: DUF3108 domain-containing protein [Rhodanobacteraceae]MDQ7997592.1 DUF3108 domain-containing protein [Luteibacter sp.]MDQ8047885.1 DUF3108 domain-containing protein [Luteibacter sp.]SDG45224.1 Protein of unknown function [Dyella sp. 333MFSha]SKB89506.1 Protein of unknown function [Luteibacter sp. 22Crub2.1]